MLLAPTALEVVFSTSLIFAKWGKGRRHLLLTAEGWSYFVLSIIELLSSIVPAVRGDLSLFRGFDSGIGIASFLPIFFYTFFLYLFSSSDLVDIIPRRLKNVIKLALIIFVPAIVIFNEVASFIGVTIRNVAGNRGIPSVGFTNKNQEALWTFFTSLTLALLTLYQATLFCLTFFRLVQAILHQRRIENKGSDKAHFVNGTGWLVLGTKLGALDTVIGFGGGGFGLSLTRRILRLLSRACICIGLVKGVDAVEDFQAVRDEIVSAGKNGQQNFRRSRLMQFIANPRRSTFRQLSPTATAFHSAPRALSLYDEKSRSSDSSMKAPHYTTFSQRQSMQTLQSGLPGMNYFASVKEKTVKKRVTVQYKNGTPTLHMRFSTLDVPSPSTISEILKNRQENQWYTEGGAKRRYTQSSYFFDANKMVSPKEISNAGYKENENDSILELPKPSFYPEKADSYRNSLNSSISLGGPYEIVNAPVRKLSQESAKPRIVRARGISDASTPQPHSNKMIETMAAMTFLQPIYRPPLVQASAKTKGRSIRPSGDFDARVKSMVSVRSVPDSILAVRELASQFPGPPAPFQYMPESSDNHSSWEDDNRTSVFYPPNLMPPQVLGSPSELTFKNYDERGNRVSDATWGNRESQATHIVSRAGKVPVTPEYRATPPRARAFSYSKSIDPFADDDETDFKEDFFSSPSSQPVYAPVGKPLRETLRKLPAPPSVLLPRKHSKTEVPESPEGVTPKTMVSEISVFPVARDIAHDGDSPLDLGAALDTGASRQFRPNRAGQSGSSMIINTPAAYKSTTKIEKFDRIAKWVDTSASVAVVQQQSETEIPVRDGSLHNLHERGKSIDQLSMGWPKALIEGTTLLSTSSNKPQLSRLKSVGKVPSKRTPTPMAHRIRGSLHLRPILIPPKSGNMPQAIQVEVGSLESVGDHRGVLRDVDALELEETVPTRASNYF